MKRKINVVLLGGWFHQKTVEVEDDGDPMIELYPQAGAGQTWVYKIASDADLTLLGLSRLTMLAEYTAKGPLPRYATLVGPK